MVKDSSGYSAPQPDHPAVLWHNGRLVAWEDATVHLTDIGWTAISAVFEGVRAYRTYDGDLAFFRLDQHLKRLSQSMTLMRMTLPWTLDEVRAGMVDVVQACGYRDDVYLQPLAYFGGSVPGYEAAYTQPGEIYITARPAHSRLRAPLGSHVCVSSWTRIADNVMPPRAKALANYQNSRLVATEARINGYDTGIVLNDRGKVSEGAWSCVVIIRDGIAVTPGVTSDILEGITRASVLELLHEELGLPVEEREVDRTELYIADEVLLCGTLVEIEPVLSVDRYAIGAGLPGPVTQRLMGLFERTVRAEEPQYAAWLDLVGVTEVAAAGAAEEGWR